jgi:hypothetical protein
VHNQIDGKLETLLSLEEIKDEDIKVFFGELPKDQVELLSIIKNLMKHIRTYGRKSGSLERYIKQIKERIV